MESRDPACALPYHGGCEHQIMRMYVHVRWRAGGWTFVLTDTHPLFIWAASPPSFTKQRQPLSSLCN